MAVPRERYGGREHLAQRQPAEQPVRLAQPRDRAGRRDRTRSVEVLVIDDAGPAEVADRRLAGQFVHVGAGVERPAHREAHDATLIADLVNEVAAPADAAGLRLDDADGEAGRNRRVDRVAAALQHLQTGARGVDVLRRDHTARGARLALADGHPGRCGVAHRASPVRGGGSVACGRARE